MKALADGADFNPPGYFVTARAFLALTGAETLRGLRYLSLVSVLVGLLALYALTGSSFGIVASVAGVALVWLHPLIQKHAFEARFYGLWFASVALLALLFWRCSVSVCRKRSLFLLFLLAAYVCSLHWFGVLAVGLVVSGQTVIAAQRPGTHWRALGAASVGAASALLYYPFFVGQRSALSGQTWVKEPTVGGVASFLEVLINPGPLVAVLLVTWISVLWGARKSGSRADTQSHRVVAVSGLSGLLALPLLLVVFSYAIQPATVPRYGVPAVLGLAPVVAWLVSRSGGAVSAILAILLVCQGGFAVRQSKQAEHNRETVRLSLAERVGGLADSGIPIVFERRLDLWPLWHIAPHLRSRCWFLDLRDDEMLVPNPVFIVERDVGRVVGRHYPTPRTISLEGLGRIDHFFFMARHESPQRLARLLGELDIRALGDRLFEVARRDDGESPRTATE